MSELLPVAQAEQLRGALLEYLGTTFALADASTRASLEDFLRSPSSGLFRGPYVRLRLPFRPAAPGWRDALEWYEGFPPYGHQAAAFRRLSSLGPDGAPRRPEPTLVTTGTGSGKTESFLYPILDHVRRAKRAGWAGLKAIVLYPMNALANDQAKRLTDLLTTRPALAGITAALYTGQAGPQRTTVSTAGLITDRSVIRDSPPDILLTNYKMLDQLLLRSADAKLWSASALSLQYLVLDEFHTYNGAQGTDVAMLLRRLGLALKAHWPAAPAALAAAGLTAPDLARPLGRVTPVATSATLGGDGDPATMLDFARTIFGEDFPPDAVVTESRLSLAEWVGDARKVVAARGIRALDADNIAVGALLPALERARDPRAIARTVLSHLYRFAPADADYVDPSGPPADLSTDSPEDLLTLAKAHPLVSDPHTGLAAAAREAVDVSDLARAVFRPSSEPAWEERSQAALTAVLSALTHIRKEAGRGALSVDVHLWTRELTRLNRAASGVAQFSWQDEGVVVEDADGAGEEGGRAGGRSFPAIYCRHCGRSGWGVVLAPTGTDLDPRDADIRGRHLRSDDRFRPLIHAPAEGEQAEAGESVSNLWWFLAHERRLTAKAPTGDDVDGAVLPVLSHPMDDAGARPARDDDCPSCGQRDGIRFLGSAIATLLSVTLSSLFGTPGLDPAEKKALVFTDSVQDAAHRAGFVQARSHALTLRAVIRQAMSDQPTDLATLIQRMIDQAGDDPKRRYRLLPPDLAEREKFATFWQGDTQAKVHYTVRHRVRRRLALDVLMEFGLRSAVGRTLAATGSAVAEARAEPSVLLAAARAALTEPDRQGILAGFEPTDAGLLAWVRGVLEHMRRHGAIHHEWFKKFREEDGNRWWLTGGRPGRRDGMPGFGRGLSAPGFPRVGGAVVTTAGTKRAGEDLEPVGSPRGWYAAWTAKCLRAEPAEAAVLARLLLKHLARLDVVGTTLSSSGGTTFHLTPESVVVQAVDLPALAAGQLCLACAACGSTLPGTPAVVDQLLGAPCLVARCTGTLARHAVFDNFYRRMYEEADPARVVAREHTSMLDDEVRLEYEQAFKSPDPAPNAPNVLVATPTLELGIDIGELSTVLLSSLPRSVASYLQRVGRAGRQTGSALALAFVTARGDQLPRFAKPTDVLNGAVRPPTTYLDAEEILRRQYFASLADELARRPGAPHPRTASEALGSSEPGTFLGAVIALADAEGPALLDRFLAGFPDLSPAVEQRLRAWALPGLAPTGGSTPSDLARRSHEASIAWRTRMEGLAHRELEIQAALSAPDGLRVRADSPAATEADERARRTAEAAVKLTQYQRAEASSEHWVGVLEEYGLLPNYTLVDDSVSLEVSLSWMDPDTQEYRTEHMELSRGSAQALRDFAPGATFYARGYAIQIDALDLGRSEHAVRTWACCPACGYTQDVTDADAPGAEPAPARCPRCAEAGVADVAQRIEVVALQRVTSVIRREEATIDDRSDERRRERYTIRTLADVDPHAPGGRQWFVEDYGFGVRYQRQMRIRWLNLGRDSAHGATLQLAGQPHDVALFRVCEQCGKLDTSTGTNRAAEHRPWCPLRKAGTEQVRTVALARSLTTEGLVLRLPVSVTLGDEFALPSLRTALLLALQMRMGGEPDHLDVTEIVDPSPAAGAPTGALLVHDVVRGGTGYLAELAEHRALWGMLRSAWDYLQACPCQAEGRLACERCLLPYARPHEVDRVSRSAAARHLRAILLGGASIDAQAEVPAACEWTITVAEPEVADPESHLELLFRKALLERLQRLGATVAEKPGPSGNTWSITMPGGALWRLEPQVLVHEAGTKPDFVLTSDRPGIPRTAIYTDGLRYHAGAGVNRLADDAAKRQALRDVGYQVLAFVWDDVAPTGRSGAAGSGAGGGSGAADPSAPVPWLHPQAAEVVLAEAKDRLSPAALRLVTAPALDLLTQWIERPDVRAREQLAQWLPMLFARSVTPAFVNSDVALPTVALGALDHESPAKGIRYGGTWVQDTLGVAIRQFVGETTEIAVVLDDADDAVGPDHKAAWREWLHLANLLNFRAATPTSIGTRSMLTGTRPAGATSSLEAAERASHVEDELTRRLAKAPDWRNAAEYATSAERELLIAVLDLAELGIEAPTIGDEFGDGVPLSLAWADRMVTVEFADLSPEIRGELRARGWTVVDAEPAAIRAALIR